MAIIKAKKVSAKNVLETAEDTLCRFCYYFPQYSYFQAQQLPYKRVKKMLSIAKKERAKMMYDLTTAVSAPHTEKGKGVKKFLGSLKEIIES